MAGAKPLSETIPLGWLPMKSHSQFIYVHSRKCISKCRQERRPFFLGLNVKLHTQNYGMFYKDWRNQYRDRRMDTLHLHKFAVCNSDDLGAVLCQHVRRYLVTTGYRPGHLDRCHIPTIAPADACWHTCSGIWTTSTGFMCYLLISP